jgi:type IV secretion system protein TrbL
MTTASPAGLDLFLNNFRSQVDSGFGLISGDVQKVLATLVVISIVTTAILWAIDENQNVLASLVRKVLLIGFFVWLVAQWHTLSQTVVAGFASLGLKAGGGAMNLGDFLNSPSKIVMKGIAVCVSLFDYIQKLAPGPVEFFAHFATILMALIACIGVLLAFVLLAIEVTVVVIEFHIVTLIAFVTVPFGILTQTSFLSERAIGYVVSVGIKLMALAIVISIGSNIFNGYTVSSDPDIYEEVGLLLAAVVLLMLALKIPAIAGALISGGPQLSAGSAVAGAAGIAAGVAGIGLAGRMAGGAVAAGARSVSAARAAAGAIPGGGPAGSPGAPGGTGAAGPSRPAAAGGAASSPVSGAFGQGRGDSSEGSGASSSDVSAAEGPASSAPSNQDSPVARARARSGGGWIAAARTAAVAASAGSNSGGPGMAATPAPTREETQA